MSVHDSSCGLKVNFRRSSDNIFCLWFLCFVTFFEESQSLLKKFADPILFLLCFPLRLQLSCLLHDTNAISNNFLSFVYPLCGVFRNGLLASSPRQSIKPKRTQTKTNSFPTWPSSAISSHHARRPTSLPLLWFYSTSRCSTFVSLATPSLF